MLAHGRYVAADYCRHEPAVHQAYVLPAATPVYPLPAAGYFMDSIGTGQAFCQTDGADLHNPEKKIPGKGLVCLQIINPGRSGRLRVTCGKIPSGNTAGTWILSCVFS